ncbi:hypothetical protein DEO72_LG8g487 [Vigna unguiculata]|uniref:Uncharacterized protein n=1 Tax=Vigna unguiculata TaxID=3917 RepID=A0A4D6MRG4_VIGUN|nr:hypothetical protein DEO72_LG8g487 [Vigna unguiculata]
MSSKKNKKKEKKKNLWRERSSPDTRRRAHFPAMENRIEFRSETEKEKNENRKIA